MDEQIFQRNEFMDELEITEDDLGQWEKLGLVQHLGTIDGNIPFFTEVNVSEAQNIKQLLSVGYSLPEIQKIVRKVGLPRKKKKKSDQRLLITVGELAELTGLNSRTIKYWEERGIIYPDGRSNGGFRLYSKTTVELCQYIKDLQNFGYSLDEIKEAADLYRQFIKIKNNSAKLSPAEVEASLETIMMRLTLLQQRMSQLKKGIHRWEDLLKKHKKEFNQVKLKIVENTKPQISKQKTKS